MVHILILFRNPLTSNAMHVNKAASTNLRNEMLKRSPDLRRLKCQLQI